MNAICTKCPGVKSARALSAGTKYRKVLGVNAASAICWFQSYLTDRTQCVRLGSTVSDPVTLEKGVPQGSILGPLLFLLHANTICNQMQFSTYHMYADDTIVYS